MDEVETVSSKVEEEQEAENSSTKEMDVDVEETAKKEKKKKSKKKKDRDRDSFLPDINQPMNSWVRNADDPENIYYYNSQTGESVWLPQCKCGKRSVKWCVDCKRAFCFKDFDNAHSEESMQDHKVTPKEIPERPQLDENEEYCIKCTIKKAGRICMECWDSYCSECFSSVHSVGYLKCHKSMAYQRARMGWYCVRRYGHEPDYYVNGATKETSFEKPEELMTELEKIHLSNFRAHRDAAAEHVQTIEKLQFELEAAKYERDKLIVESVANGGHGSGDKDKHHHNEKKASDVIDHAKKGGSSSGMDEEYRNKLMHPSDRRRGQARTNYIKSLLENPNGN